MAILVVDDDPTVLRFVCEVLARRGHAVIAAASGEEGMAIAEQSHGALSLVISDIVMSGVCGVQLAQWVQRNSPGTPVLLMTGYVYAHLSGELQSPPPVLQKPFTVTDLLAKVGELLPGPATARGGR